MNEVNSYFYYFNVVDNKMKQNNFFLKKKTLTNTNSEFFNQTLQNTVSGKSME
jgi:hypothetical protein